MSYFLNTSNENRKNILTFHFEDVTLEELLQKQRVKNCSLKTEQNDQYVKKNVPRFSFKLLR